ncbi:TonB-dependent receptor [Paucihalobacter ruber]|uniref:TonB-dependent receptor n=1 Tax=Paucihalobacter ruber TaxID=2567861 RepID=A0A506PNK7_9FLAO|nr:TonB-dependent receptor [Paucihalobacter ruber]TPV34787.1 TonB-dependent receptor [Paucihalobacter ruber]
MKKKFLLFLFGISLTASAFAQLTTVKGTVRDATTGEPIPDATITIESTLLTTKTNAVGEFIFTENLPLGEQILKVEMIDYGTKRFPIVINEGGLIDLDTITLDYDPSDKKDMFIIAISDDNLLGDDNGLVDNISGLLQSSRDVFLNAAAFDFSATFFRPRGLDNANGKVLINGIEMNKQFDGRPQWGNWGGLNDVQRNQEFTQGMTANDYSFGDLAGTNNILMRASSYRKGGRISYASANRSYTGRIMGSYSSGLLNNGWSYSLLISRRFGDEGFVEGTMYDANSAFAAVEKKINDKHSINFTGIYAQNRRGRSTAITDEVFRLKGREYNPFWGELNGEIRNSRMREINEPVLMLNHYWDISSKTRLNTNVSYQFGEIANSRIDNGGTRLVEFNDQEVFIGGARNPDPAWYQNLPSYQLRFPNPTPLNFQLAYLSEQEFRQNGQLDWNRLYGANQLLANQGGNSLYAILEDVIADKQFTINTILDHEINQNIRLNANLNYRSLRSENFARLNDLLGGTGYLDVDFFADENDNNISDEIAANLAQSDLRNRNRIVREGERYKYNYEINSDVVSSFVQAQFNYNKIDFYIGANVSNTTYQRIGLYENGFFPGEGNDGSFGKSDKLSFTNYGVKGGGIYKITGRHLLQFNGSHYTKAPGIRSSFSNARQTNATVIGLDSETISSVDFGYIYRSPLVNGRISAYYAGFQNGTNIGFYFTQGLAGLGLNNADAFVQEITTNVDRRNIGVEFGLDAQVTPTIKLKAAGSFSQYVFTNDPNLYLTSVDFDGALTFGDGTTQLKNFHVSGGPERAFQLGFEYRDPDFWNFGVTANYFSHAYINISNLARSANFSLDFDGNPNNQYDPEIARQLLRQERFDDYTLFNVIGGKSWKVGDYFIGFFATINNVFNTQFKTGGFEQSRNANYNRVLEDQSREYGPLFGPRYFFGNGTTYYLNTYIRF